MSGLGTGLTDREKLVATGMYLSKFDTAGLAELGFSGFTEAFQVLGFALNAKPASINNYRDEFDPLFPNSRKGWHRRPTRSYCLAVYEKLKNLDFLTFTSLIRSFFGAARNEDSERSSDDQVDGGFAKRLVTGLAAQNYFQRVFPDLAELRDHDLEDTTMQGCGYDFRLHPVNQARGFLAVEVKGLSTQTGSVMLTAKEYSTAELLRDRFFLFVVRNFAHAPAHEIFRDPIHNGPPFRKVERVVIQTSWVANV